MSVRLAVSNIAWSPANDSAVAQLLVDEGVTGVELAPTMWRDNPYDAPRADVVALRTRWENRGLAIASLQALLFGRPEVQLFGDAASRAALDTVLRQAIDFAHMLGARALVFGAPKNRQRGVLPMRDAMSIAADFFTPLAEYAHARGAAICLEANPAEYGCDFLVRTSEAVELCRAIDHPGVRVNGDVGGMILAGEDVTSSVEAAAPYLGHFHASEPQLAALASEAAHARAAASLERIGYDGWASIEMRRGERDEMEAIRRAIRFARNTYSVGRRAKG